MFGDPMTNSKHWTDYELLKDVTEIVLGSTPNSKNPKYWDGTINWITPAELSEQSYFVYDTERHITKEGFLSANLTIMPIGTVLFSTRAPIGKVAITGQEMCCNQGFKNFVCSNRLNNVFLYYTLKFKKDYLCSLGTGTTFKELSKKVIETLRIAVPPIELQNEFEQIYNQADKSGFVASKSRFIEMFGSLSRNEKNWPVGRMTDACTYISDGSHYSPPDDMNSDIPMLSVKDMDHRGFVYDDCKHLSQSEYEKLCQNGCKPLLNDVLVAKDGSYFKYIFPLEQEREQAVLSSIAILRPNSEKITPRFLCELLKSKEVLGIVEQHYLTGTAIRRVILKGFRDLKVFFPPLELQNEFEQIYNQADKSGLVN
jgi:type I restriction enzyme S subunit